MNILQECLLSFLPGSRPLRHLVLGSVVIFLFVSRLLPIRADHDLRRIARRLSFLFLAAMAGTAVYEVLMMAIFPDITIWGSHFMTIAAVLR